MAPDNTLSFYELKKNCVQETDNYLQHNYLYSHDKAI